MGFRTAASGGAAAAQSAPREERKAGGRFHGIRPKAASDGPPLLTAGDYIFDFTRTKKNRKSDGLVLDGKVFENSGNFDNETAAGVVGRAFLNFGEYSDEQLVTLAMSVCDVDSAEQLERQEPFYDVLIDALSGVASAEMFCRPGEKDPAFGVNPLAGIRILLKLRENRKGNLDKNGKPYLNAYFERCPEEYKAEAPF